MPKAGKRLKVPISKLIFDSTVYPRCEVSGGNVSALRQKLRSGIDLDPIVVEEKTFRIIDGVHRWRARQKEEGPDSKVDVLTFTYKDEPELLLHAAQLNFQHGQRLNTSDLALVVDRLRQGGLGEEDVCGSLGISRGQYERLSVSWAWADGKTTRTGGSTRRGKKSPPAATGPTGEKIFLKSALSHLAGQQLNESQVAVADRAIGNRQKFLVGRVIDFVENDMADLEDAELLARLRRLRDLLNSFAALEEES